MKHDHQQFRPLPAPLPDGERVVWQGRPTYKGLALRAFHIREVGIYFGLILMWRLWSNWRSGASPTDAAISALWIIVPALVSFAVLGGLAWLFYRATTYTITNRRILFQFGVALQMTMNVPLTKIAQAALRTYRDGSGDIPVKLTDNSRVSFVLMWPHIRPWKLRLSQPMLRSVPNAHVVAAKLAEVLLGQPGSAALAKPNFGDQDHGMNATSQSPITAAA